MSLNGTLFRYGDKSAQVAVMSGAHFRRHLILLGGLGDSLLFSKYIEPLSISLEANQWSLVQPLLSSSMSGWGVSTLNEDALELESLLQHLSKHNESEAVVLMGHSTGCQIIVTFLREQRETSKLIKGAILQGPVSDREYLETLPETEESLKVAKTLIFEGKGEELLPRSLQEIPVTAKRFFSLASVDGDDDIFSSDFPLEKLSRKLGHMSKLPVLIIFSEKDEYVPQKVDKEQLLKRLSICMGGAIAILAPNANHSLSNWSTQMVKEVNSFLQGKLPSIT